MKLGSLNGLRGKRLSLTLIIIFTTFLIWGWERKPHRESLRQPQEEDLFLQVPPVKYVHQHPSDEEDDFPDSETIGHRSSETELQSDKPVGSTTINKATRVDRDFESVPSTTLNK